MKPDILYFSSDEQPAEEKKGKSPGRRKHKALVEILYPIEKLLLMVAPAGQLNCQVPTLVNRCPATPWCLAVTNGFNWMNLPKIFKT